MKMASTAARSMPLLAKAVLFYREGYGYSPPYRRELP